MVTWEEMDDEERARYYTLNFSRISNEQKAEYYRRFLELSPSEKREFKQMREEILAEDPNIHKSSIPRIVEQQDIEARKILKEQIKMEEEDVKLRKKIGVEYGAEREPYDEPDFLKYRRPKEFGEEMAEKEIDIEEEPEVDEGERLAEKFERGVESAQEIGRGIIGVGSREPVKKAILGAGAKVVEALKPKPKSKEEAAKEKKLKSTYEEAKFRQELKRAKVSGYKKGAGIPEERKEPSVFDLGKTDVGATRYEPRVVPPVREIPQVRGDLLGLSEFYSGGGGTPMGKPLKHGRHPPSTHIPFGGEKAPDVRVRYGRKPPETRTVVRRPKTRTYVKIPKGVKKAGKRVRKIETKIPPPKREDAVSVLGLEGYW